MRPFALSLLAFAGCYHPSATWIDGSTGGSGDDAAGPSDAAIDAMPDAFMLGWTKPAKIMELDAAGDDSDPTMTADRLKIVWKSTRTGGVGGDDLWMATRLQTTEPFSNLVNLTALNTTSDEQAPEISPDGNTLWFTSNRNTDTDVFMSTWNGMAWTAPVSVDELNTASDEMELAVAPDLLTLMLDRSNKFYIATRATTTAPWGALKQVPELHITSDVASPTLGDNASVVYFHAGATRDIYVARKIAPDLYSAPQLVTEIDTPTAREADPHINGPETFMVFNCGSALCTTTRP